MRELDLQNLESLYLNIESNSKITSTEINQFLDHALVSKNLKNIELYFTKLLNKYEF